LIGKVSLTQNTEYVIIALNHIRMHRSCTVRCGGKLNNLMRLHVKKHWMNTILGLLLYMRCQRLCHIN